MSHASEPAIDRLSATHRPRRRAAMYQKWRKLLFLHWSIPVEALRALVPQALEIDTYEGRAYVGLVPFTMRDIRPVGLPAVPGISNFHETNVRTYVHLNGRDPGVWFFSLDAAGALGVAIGRALFHLPYFYARMRLDVLPDGSIDYHSERRGSGLSAKVSVRWRPTGTPAPSTPGTLDHFLLERYLLYATHRGRLFQGQVYHPPYLAQTAEVSRLDETLLQAAGLRRPSEPPLIHYAEGVDPEIFWIKNPRPDLAAT